MDIMSDCVVCDNCGAHKKYMNRTCVGFGYGYLAPKHYDVCDKKCALEIVKKKTKNWGKWWA
jgi:hypothetical protein